jgi:hypothetical protein
MKAAASPTAPRRWLGWKPTARWSSATITRPSRPFGARRVRRSTCMACGSARAGRWAGRRPHGGRHWKFSKAEIAWLEENCALEISAYHAGVLRRLRSARRDRQQPPRLRKRRGWKTGRTGHFQPGHTSANKGKRCPEGRRRPPPERPPDPVQEGRASAQHEASRPRARERRRLCRDQRRRAEPVHRRRPPLRPQARLALGEGQRPGPGRHCLKCLDGNRLNTDPETGRRSRARSCPRINGGRASRLAYDTAAPEVRPVIMAIAKVEHRARKMKRREITP